MFVSDKPGYLTGTLPPTQIRFRKTYDPCQTRELLRNLLVIKQIASRSCFIYYYSKNGRQFHKKLQKKMNCYKRKTALQKPFLRAFYLFLKMFKLKGNNKQSIVNQPIHAPLLENLYLFSEKAFGEGQEMLIIVTELTAASDSASFISHYGSPGYFRHNKELLFYERQIQVISEIDRLQKKSEDNSSLSPGKMN